MLAWHLNRGQPIILTNAYLIHWCIYAALGDNELCPLQMGTEPMQIQMEIFFNTDLLCQLEQPIMCG